MDSPAHDHLTDEERAEHELCRVEGEAWLADSLLGRWDCPHGNFWMRWGTNVFSDCHVSGGGSSPVLPRTPPSAPEQP